MKMLKQFINLKKYYGFLFIFTVMFSPAECKKSRKLPADIKLCEKNDSQLDNCLINLFESLRPKLKEGIPELDLAPLDPLILKEVVVFPGGSNQMKAIGRDFKIIGMSNWKIKSLKTNIKKMEYEISIYFPYIQYEGSYDVNAKLSSLPVKGKGPISGNATDVNINALLKGKFVEIEGEKFVEFTSAKVNITVKDYSVKVEKLFPDEQLNDAINKLLNDRRMQSMSASKQLMNKLAGNMILQMVNKISMNLAFEEIFA